MIWDMEYVFPGLIISMVGWIVGFTKSEERKFGIRIIIGFLGAMFFWIIGALIWILVDLTMKGVK